MNFGRNPWRHFGEISGGMSEGTTGANSEDFFLIISEEIYK